MSAKYAVKLTASARRQITETLPEAVAAAVWEFISGPLRENPHRVGKRLQEPRADTYSARRGIYRVLYQIDDTARSIVITAVRHRSDAYRF